MDDGVALSDVREELVPKALAGGRALHDACDAPVSRPTMGRSDGGYGRASLHKAD